MIQTLQSMTRMGRRWQAHRSNVALMALYLVEQDRTGQPKQRARQAAAN